MLRHPRVLAAPKATSTRVKDRANPVPNTIGIMAVFQVLGEYRMLGDWLARPGEVSISEIQAFSFPIPRDAVAYIMDTFPIVRRKDEEKYNGDYRTKRVILEIFDALAESIRTGEPYQTRLAPPPADPRCCHPPLGDRMPLVKDAEAGH
jgi:hypothetical protein